MSKKAFFLSWSMAMYLLLAAFCIFALAALAYNFSSYGKSAAEDDKTKNEFSTFVRYLSDLRIEDGQKQSPSVFDKNYVLETFRRCEKAEQSASCFPNAKICLKNIKDKNKPAVCEEIKGIESEIVTFENKQISGQNTLLVQKKLVKEENGIRYTIIEITKKT